MNSTNNSNQTPNNQPQSAAQFPKWSKAWQNNLPEIDSVICSCCTSDNAQQNLPQIQSKVEGWFENQTFDPQTRAEYEQVKQHPEILQSKIEHRVDYLRQNGKLGTGKTLAAGASHSADAAPRQNTGKPGQ
jgi:hypothetical protein